LPASFDPKPVLKDISSLEVKGEEEKCDVRVKGPELDPKLLMTVLDEAT